MLSNEQIIQLKALLDAGVLTQAEYDAKVNPNEKFSWKKFWNGIVNLMDPVGWAKDLHSIFNLRKIVVYALILGAIFGWGFLRGVSNKPVHIDNLQGKEAIVEIVKDELYMHITKEGTIHIQDEKGKTLKQITVKDIPALQKSLMPIGIDLKPFATLGAGAGGNKSGMEGGLGYSLFKFYKTHLDVFATNFGIYAGADYSLTDNFGVLVGVGKGYSMDDSRVYIGGKWNF